MKTYKITYFFNNILRQKEIQMSSWHELTITLQSWNISEWEVIKIEVIPEE